ncbi:hypothetical protein [Lysinibacillus sp. FSL W8-0953]|uniref:hypothetical protein n=1 Tax=Lysinibacillus sp. FSL W8-0953 TaxID=2954640 RepID=UPI0030F6A71C
MKITEELIPLIEKALGFKLYEWQRAYLLEKPYSEPLERVTGRTTVYVIKLLLTNREPINIKFDAMRYKDHSGVHYADLFRNYMREIDAKLTAVGLPTRTVKPKKSRGITIEVGVDTDKLQLKLRAIAKHVGALADELDGIDKGIGCDNCKSYHVYETGPEHLACGNCKMQFHKTNAMLYNESPTRLEGGE